MNCCFAGHTNVFASGLEKALDTAIDRILSETDTACFYVGGRGEFDAMAASAVRGAKARYYNKTVQLFLVEPYMSAKINKEKTKLALLYDGIIIPQELAGVHPKSAITKRNRLMVEWSDCLIAFVHRDFGGAFEMVRYAVQKNKTIISLCKDTSKPGYSPAVSNNSVDKTGKIRIIRVC